MTELYQLFKLCLLYAPSDPGEGFTWVAGLDLSEWSAEHLDAVTDLGFIQNAPSWADEMERKQADLWEVVAPRVLLRDHYPNAARLRGLNMFPLPATLSRTITATDDQGRPTRLRVNDKASGDLIARVRRSYEPGRIVTAFVAYRADGTAWGRWRIVKRDAT